MSEMTQEQLEWEERKKQVPSIKEIVEYKPVGDCLLTTATYSISEEKEDLGDKVQKYRNYHNVQTVLGIGTGVDKKNQISKGDTVQLDIATVLEKFDDCLAYANTRQFAEDSMPSEIFFRVPLYMVKGIVKINERRPSDAEAMAWFESKKSEELKDR